MEHKRYTIKKDENPLEKMARAIRAYQLANSGKKPKAIFISEAGKRVLAPYLDTVYINGADCTETRICGVLVLSPSESIPVRLEVSEGE